MFTHTQTHTTYNNNTGWNAQEFHRHERRDSRPRPEGICFLQHWICWSQGGKTYQWRTWSNFASHSFVLASSFQNFPSVVPDLLYVFWFSGLSNSAWPTRKVWQGNHGLPHESRCVRKSKERERKRKKKRFQERQRERLRKIESVLSLFLSLWSFSSSFSPTFPPFLSRFLSLALAFFFHTSFILSLCLAYSHFCACFIFLSFSWILKRVEEWLRFKCLCALRTLQEFLMSRGTKQDVTGVATDSL